MSILAYLTLPCASLHIVSLVQESKNPAIDYSTECEELCCTPTLSGMTMPQKQSPVLVAPDYLPFLIITACF